MPNPHTGGSIKTERLCKVKVVKAINDTQAEFTIDTPDEDINRVCTIDTAPQVGDLVKVTWEWAYK